MMAVMMAVIMAGNVKCILRCVAARSLLAGTALQAKNGDGGEV
jgi:hypothetical protein